MQTPKYTHLHLHTEYSLLDGANKIKKLAKHLKSSGFESCAITDHGNMYGAIEFYKTMKSEGIKPIIGIEAYIHNASDIGSKESKQRFHLCLFAKNEIGYQNLMYLSSMSFIRGYYYYPRINKAILKAHSEGLCCSAACLAGEVSFHLNQNERNLKRGAGGYEEAKRVALEYKEIFGEDFYLEIMRHGIADQLSIDDEIIRLAKETGIKLIATNDAHYTTQDSAIAQKIFVYISANKNYDERVKAQILPHFYTKTATQMSELFADMPEILSNTQEIVDKCNLQIELGNATPPNFKFTREYANERDIKLPYPSSEHSLENDSVLFEYECEKGLEERLKFIPIEKHESYKNRLRAEIEIIKKMKFPGYMLIVADFINEAKRRGIPVGPGRGSAAGSLVSYALRITDIDPLPYNLLFERFLNPERVSMPDIDVDFCQNRRAEIIDYVVEKYGKYNVAQVATFGKLLAKGVIRDVARVMGMPYADADAMAKLIPDELGISLKAHEDKSGKMVDGAFEKEPKIAELISKNDLARQVWEYSIELEGLNRQAGMHAAGIVISNEELWKKTPLWRQAGEDEGCYVTQYTKDYLEEVDLIKFDFLGLKTLTVIDNAIQLIKKRSGKQILWEEIDMNDPKTYQTIQSGNTLGIFQIESGGMQNLASRLKPDCFEDIIAMLALYRPGPLESGMVDDFIDIKHGKKKMEFAFSELEPILSPTYGVIVYQEQVMQVVQKIGGFTLGGADLVRRAMGKKKADEMARLKSQYLEGAAKNGFDTDKADHLFELIMKFAEYGFNKSHSAAYAMITFQTAYLKTHYPAEFMAAILTSEERKIEKVAVYIDEIKRMGLGFLPPDINLSSREFGVVKSGDGDAIIYGLGAVRGVGKAAIEEITRARSEGKIQNMEDFITKTSNEVVNKKVVESLIKSGAFDAFGHYRKTLLENVEVITSNSKRLSEIQKESVNSLFGDDEAMMAITLDFAPAKSEYSKKELLAFEQETLGIYVSGHPLDDYKAQIDELKPTSSAQFESVEDGCEVLVVAKVESANIKITKSGKKMAVLTLLDYGGSYEVTAFDEYSKIENSNTDEPFAMKLLVQKDGEQIKLKLNEAFSLNEARETKITLKQARLSEEDIAKNAELFGVKHSKISEIMGKIGDKSEYLIFAKLSNITFRTAKSGIEMAILNATDESSNSEMLAFEASKKMSDIDLNLIWALGVQPPKDSNSKPVINQLISVDEVLNGAFSLRKGRKGGYSGDGNGDFHKKDSDYESFAAKSAPKITGDIEVEIELNGLAEHKIREIYNLAHSYAKLGDKRLILRVKTSKESLVYKTDLIVKDEFKERLNLLLVG